MDRTSEEEARNWFKIEDRLMFTAINLTLFWDKREKTIIDITDMNIQKGYKKIRKGT